MIDNDMLDFQRISCVEDKIFCCTSLAQTPTKVKSITLIETEGRWDNGNIVTLSLCKTSSLTFGEIQNRWLMKIK